MNIRTSLPLLFLLPVLGMLASCQSIEQMAIGKISDMLSSDEGAGAFTRDDDPQLVADALPFTLKIYEILMEKNPEDSALRLAAGKAFVMYASGFIQMPASMLPDEEYREQEKMIERARKMYIRGRRYILESIYLDVKESETLLAEDLDGFLTLMEPAQIPALYWSAAAWLGAFSCDPFNSEAGLDLYKSIAFLYQILSMDDDYGGVHDVMISLWGSLPRALIDMALLEAPATVGQFVPAYYEKKGTPNEEEARARYHFARSTDLSEGKNPAIYVSLATTFPVKHQDYDEFESLLNQALKIDPYAYPEEQLLIIIYQEKARWLLDHREDFFLVDFQ